VRAYVKCFVSPDYSFPLAWTLHCWCCRLDLFELRDLDCAVGKHYHRFNFVGGDNRLLSCSVFMERVTKEGK